MLKLGTFVKDQNSEKITGVFYCVGMQPTPLLFEPSVNGEGRSYYKIYADTFAKKALVEAGSAWPKTAENGKAAHYYSVRLNSPAFAEPLYGKLYPSDVICGQYHLLWDEQDRSAMTGTQLRKFPQTH